MLQRQWEQNLHPNAWRCHALAAAAQHASQKPHHSAAFTMPSLASARDGAAENMAVEIASCAMVFLRCQHSRELQVFRVQAPYKLGGTARPPTCKRAAQRAQLQLVAGAIRQAVLDGCHLADQLDAHRRRHGYPENKPAQGGQQQGWNESSQQRRCTAGQPQHAKYNMTMHSSTHDVGRATRCPNAHLCMRSGPPCQSHAHSRVQLLQDVHQRDALARLQLRHALEGLHQWGVEQPLCAPFNVRWQRLAGGCVRCSDAGSRTQGPAAVLPRAGTASAFRAT